MIEIGHNLQHAIDKINGRQAEIKCKSNDGLKTAKFDNNYKMREFTNLLDRFNQEYEVVYTRREWFRKIIRVIWILSIVMLSFSLTFTEFSVAYRLWDISLLIFYVSTFREYVIDMNW